MVGSLIPALERIIASVTFSTAFVLTDDTSYEVLHQDAASCFSRSLSALQPEYLSIWRQSWQSLPPSHFHVPGLNLHLLTFSSSSSSCFCSCGSLPYCSSAAFFKSYFCCGILNLSVYISRSPHGASDTVLHRLLLILPLCFLTSKFISAALPVLSAESPSLSCAQTDRSSFLRAASSISSCMILRWQFIQFCRHRIKFCLDHGTCLIYQIDRLIRKKTVGDITV